MYKKTTVCAKWYIPCIFFVYKLSARPQFSILHLIKAVFTNRVRRLAVSRIDFAVDLFYLCLDFAICSKPNAKINKEKNCTID